MNLSHFIISVYVLYYEVIIIFIRTIHLKLNYFYLVKEELKKIKANIESILQVKLSHIASNLNNL